MPTRIPLTLAALVALALPSEAAEKVDFARDIRPILSDKCFKCHGPGTQKAKLRLDDRDAAVKKGALTPGKHADSTLIERVLLDDSDAGRMPPPDTADRLTPEQIAKLKKWIDDGAEYRPHWAFVPPKRPDVPKAAPGANPIDAFVRARLAQERLKPAPQADKSALMRRVTLDLTGLLPTPKEVEDFLADESSGAYEKVVDRLLASPHYGERMARHWLDLARYADSNGYTIDGPRQIWAYRDWVIKALNSDMPFDQFTREQLAGDLLPGATLDQKVATGFHRNTAFNEEGGTDPEQFRVERTIDRANTTGAVWLGLTFGCAQCHDHKYDPLPAKDYYRLYAFFDSCDEPTIPIGGPADLEKRIAELQTKVAAARLAGNDAETKKLLAEIKKVQGQVPTTLVMRERAKPRQTFVQVRGDFLRKGDEVQPGYPAAVGTTPADKRLTRLDLAKWLTSADNPLTARVTVNRAWQTFFGRGLVETENDFGLQGSFPTHPELLDWLAVEFASPSVRWSFKRLHKLIVTSDTYKQSSAARPELAEKDPRNLLLGRQSRLRLEAEIIRDVSLSASALLNPKLGGPGVFPPQPRELFQFTQSNHAWAESKGPDRYRRGMYTYIWRQSQHPLLATFDAADAQVACTKRNRSNTPLQALHLANDPAFVEFAEALGKRIESSSPSDDAGKIAFAFAVCFARTPTEAEASRVRSYLDAKRKADPKTAWAAVARVLMNLDEFITRE
ncbi:PSD1 and planctomycete cytochrome C domain-containing protein [Gemmata sp. JC717]|uniref:PSD1 and planctomycete cytochrome C domain-containing protein n=1 Tax=Gemmata algarum TaxID=2975278 RepID=UPI0021BAC1C6|nr:PSD1 and planctomycete cytochrome C domain-containing protein [Gemmata algarum]MDY3551161.1 PSD1 and planctomycete cytochrome C domain-containing protein [Gemmata algarum]